MYALVIVFAILPPATGAGHPRSALRLNRWESSKLWTNARQLRMNPWPEAPSPI